MRRVRIQGMLTVAILVTNVIGLIVGAMLLTVAFPKPSVILDAPHWVSFGIVPGYCVLAFILGTYWLTRQTARALRWAIEERTPSHDEARSAFLVPLRVALAVLFLWGAAAALWTIIYGLANRLFIPRFLFSMGVIGVVAATSCYLLTEFALRPMAAQALEVGATPRSLVRGIVGRTMLVWLLCSGVPNVGVALTAIFDDTFWELSNDQFMITVLILWAPLLIFGFILMWILAWLTATPVRVVREALNRVEQGDLSGDLVVYSTGPNSVSYSVVSTEWSRACASANAYAISSAATSVARSPQQPNASDQNWAAKSAMSPSSSSTSSVQLNWSPAGLRQRS